eukprot:jgi/Botrbrau1/14919/Bobra.0018s0023.1
MAFGKHCYISSESSSTLQLRIHKQMTRYWHSNEKSARLPLHCFYVLYTHTHIEHIYTTNMYNIDVYIHRCIEHT